MSRAVLVRDLLKKLNKTFQNLVSNELAGHGLTAPQILVLRQIYEDPKTIGQISKSVDLSYSTVSGIIDRLERQGFVIRDRDQEDRRVVWIRKTEKIMDVLKRVPVFQDSYYTRLFQGISDEQMDQIVGTLKMLIVQLEKKGDEKEQE
jgi:DNA-binding MarR family transcriptional regulator